METVTYTDARKNLAKTIEKVCDDHVPIVITRQKAESVVLISLEDYHSLEETAYLLRRNHESNTARSGPGPDAPAPRVERVVD